MTTCLIPEKRDFHIKLEKWSGKYPCDNRLLLVRSLPFCGFNFFMTSPLQVELGFVFVFIIILFEQF